jgi:hypothetical protein
VNVRKGAAFVAHEQTALERLRRPSEGCLSMGFERMSE